MKAFDPSGALVAFFPATVGSKEKPTPSGSFKVVSVDPRPTYRYIRTINSRASDQKDLSRSTRVRTIRWDRTGLGSRRRDMIHGTPEPSKVSKTSMAAFG